MAQGVRIEQGLERRDVTPGADQPVRASKVEQATVPLAPVMAPRPSSFSAIGKSAAMMGEAMKWGSKFLEEQVDRENRKNLLEGQALYAQGKSLDDLHKEGATAFTEHGWRLMDAQTSAATWHAAVMQSVEEKDHALNPDEFRTKMTGMLADITQGKDKESVDMIMAGSMKYMPDIIEGQIKAHYAYREKQTFSASVNSVAGTAQSVMDTDGRDVGKADWLAVHSPNATKVNDPSQPFEIKGPMAQLAPQRYNEAMTAGIQKAYEEDNQLAHTWAKEAGYLTNLNGTQLAQVRSSEAEYYRRKENKFDAAVIAKEFDITEGLKTNKYDILAGIGMMRELYDQKGLKLEQADLRRMSSAAAAGAAEQRGNAEAELRRQRSEADASAREAKREADNRADALAYGQYQISKVPIALAFQNKELTPEQYMDKLTKLGDDLKLKIGRGLTGEAGNAAMDAAMENLKNQARLEVIDRALSTGDVVQLYDMHGGAKLVQEALRTKETRITQQVMDKVASGKMSREIAQETIKAEWVDFLDHSGVTDKRTSDIITAVARSSPLGSNGEPTPRAMQGVAAFIDMYSKNPDMALRHVTGDAERAVMLGYVHYYTGPESLRDTVRNGDILRKTSEADIKRAQEAVAAATTTDWLKYVVPGTTATQGTLDKTVGDFIASNSPDMLEIVFDSARGNKTMTNRSEIRNGLNEDSMNRIQSQLKDTLLSEATMIKASGATTDDNRAIQLAWAKTKDHAAIIGDSLIRTPPNKTVGELMFGPGKIASQWDAHDGLISVIRRTGPDLFGADIVHPKASSTDYSRKVGNTEKSDITTAGKLFGGWDLHKVITRAAANGVLVKLKLGSEALNTNRETEWAYITWKDMGNALLLDRTQKK